MVNTKDKRGHTILTLAVLGGRIDVIDAVAKILTTKATPEQVTHTPWTQEVRWSMRRRAPRETLHKHFADTFAHFWLLFIASKIIVYTASAVLFLVTKFARLREQVFGFNKSSLVQIFVCTPLRALV